ncbi:hypothetical protein T265_04101 [Opisthorchis viverrini]|uniref:Uncharacterized protein n=1 Tax=Opisthorchis viverrini TaxID=6198 RepID=A0A074ZPB3_OPIVI|nr:hypothetical protein T265_04101 [Opisthorchis viverrini]KER29258.1 hypothetical protein T265_04101 [Opisthorchis viverrini]
MDTSLQAVTSPEVVQWLRHQLTGRKVRGLNPTSSSGLLMSRLGQPGSIPLMVDPSVSMAALHQEATASNAQLSTPHPQIVGERKCGSYNYCTTSTRFLQLIMVVMMISPMYYVYTCIAVSRISYQLKHEAAWCSAFNCYD